MMVSRDHCIFVAGASGMVGSALVRRLRADGYMNIARPAHDELDLLDQLALRSYLKAVRPDYIFVAAAKVGGIQANNQQRSEFLYQNLVIATNLIHTAHRTGVNKLMFLGSSCIYPRLAPQPIKESYLLTGELESTNEPYAIAKIAGVKLCEAYSAQYGRQYISVMPTNLYGSRDSYDLSNGHVLPALIRKCHLAKLSSQGDYAGLRRDEIFRGKIPDSTLQSLNLLRQADGSFLRLDTRTDVKLEVWGSGNPRREFLYVDDLADACVYLMQQGYAGPLINIGCGEDITIRAVAELVREIVGFSGEVTFDDSKPDGTPRKLLDISRLTATGWTAKTALSDGIKRTYDDYLTAMAMEEAVA